MERTRRPFAPEEDDQLKALVERYGTNNWKLISHYMNRRDARTCRERFNNYLNPNVSNLPWSTFDDDRLLQLMHQYLHHWTIISRNMPGRSEAQCKNRWHNHLKRHHPDSFLSLPPVSNTGETVLPTSSPVGLVNIDLIDSNFDDMVITFQDDFSEFDN
jgi:hypothetical protein